MKSEPRKAALNRALFINRPLDSRALGALVTLLHRFPEPGNYELFVRREGQVTFRGPVDVVGEPNPGPERPPAPPGASYQINLDLATLGSAEDGCPEPTPRLATGGVLGFYVSKGASHYTVTLTRIVGEKRETVLDNTAGLPEGDFFAVTLVRPGAYVVTNPLAGGRATIKVEAPQREGYRPDQVVMILAGQDAFDPAEAAILSGQSLLFQCRVPSHIVVESVDAGPTEARRATRDGERPKYTVRKRRTP
jgi:hypothetical protein